ncbi:MAG TPA: pyridoxal 5'-phosphate synthase glutaminase subunit PdxT [Bacillota bacterium]|nr:pyridoxal 5'-phosphate synthase glutaminase subunit PdxT [Bacillota bacterium]HOB86627.1 pyridoxal 5'-phosphate synthase glutaminase subunit PdxT [Bacillota bacterium]HOP69196.1 pyridoxal 5'-phosphate synthase glutaminase subunit PdxT [Bacillota bacterium]HPT34604.1 pyridoxal 5'-phosphate synthase glutaminase subunit PdxT [Bacillota bacterium]HPZ65069.1 pyridoxal 5'-phosphate synthase glutaminase subunit PdxT [Bacillota bacterium]
MAVKAGVLDFQGAVTEHLAALKRCGVEAVPVREAGQLAELDGLIIPGGESTTIGKLMAFSGMDEAIIKRCREGMALWGTCAGMVLMAKEVEGAAGKQPLLRLMDVTVRRNAFGRQRESFETKLDVKGIDHPIEGVFIRAPLIVQTGPTVEVLCALEKGIVAAQSGRLLATSFHPELTDDLSMHRYFLHLCQN